MSEYKWLPSEPTEAMLNAIFSKSGKTVDKTVFTTMWKIMWQAAPEVEQEPVGYVTKISNGNLIFTDGVPMNKESIPVYYTRTQHPRKPLSEEEVDALVDEALGQEDMKGWSMRFVRLIEKAHGIEA